MVTKHFILLKYNAKWYTNRIAIDILVVKDYNKKKDPVRRDKINKT